MIRRRLDAELVRRGLARSRGEAAELVSGGGVLVNGRVAEKPATAVGPDDALALRRPLRRYVSRGGEKLAPVLDRFRGSGLVVSGRRCLDAGASTGGFTEVLLQAGAAEVIAVDVGYGQLAWSLRTDPRVRVVERTNVRTLTLDRIGGRHVHLVVADLSFISLTLVLPALRAVAEPEADFILLVKPQFEVGKDLVTAGGVVRDPALRATAVRRVAAAAAELGLGVAAVAPSPLPGPAGNVEFFLWLRSGAPDLQDHDLTAAMAEAPA